MLVWEAHRDLSESIGDAVAANASAIPDGVRYSTAKRHDYLYRAMLEIVREINTQTASLPMQVRNTLIRRLIPSMIQEYAISLPLFIGLPYARGTRWQIDNTILPTLPSWSIMLTASYDDTYDYFPLPIKHSQEVNGLLNTRSVQRHDTFVESISGNNNLFFIYDSINQLNVNGQVKLEYVQTPRHPNTLLWTDRLDCEELFVPKMLSWATFFALADSQDLDNIDKYLPLTMTGVPANANT